MLKRISVQQLQIGMYLKEFCCSWMEHPFWRSGFVITDTEGIERIRASNVSKVWIDCAKGVESAPDKAPVSDVEVEAHVDAELRSGRGGRMLRDCGLDDAVLDVCLNHHARIELPRPLQAVVRTIELTLVGRQGNRMNLIQDRGVERDRYRSWRR